MQFGKKIVRFVLYFLLIPITYVVVSLILSTITVNSDENTGTADRTIFLASNGVHLDIVLPKENARAILRSGINYETNDNFLAFGWGDKEFYLNTPTWDDLTLKTAFKAVFLKGPALIHITRYRNIQKHWIEIEVTESELMKLNTYLIENFAIGENGEKVLLKNQGYTSRDDFYKAKGNFSFYKTCNSWVNIGFKKSGLKSCLWTPFDFGLMNKYR